MKDILLSAQNLTVGYSDGRNQHILFHNQNLTLHAGELVCFMGVNGIGKSSLIRTLAGLQKPLTPQPLSRGRGEQVPQNIAVVLTDRINAVNMTVEELITYGRYPYLDWNIRLTKEDTAIIENSIARTHISDLRKAKLYELSDGQLQMAMIARALAQDTPIILLDEPTAHLDLNNRVEIMNLLRALARTSGKAILVATHELDLALQTADVIWLATRDQKIITGMPEDLVLNGSFDDTFQFKGFDLKTGKVSQQAWRNKTVQLIGEGYEYLWTKNALERNGFLVAIESNLIIRIDSDAKRWRVENQEFDSIKTLLANL